MSFEAISNTIRNRFETQVADVQSLPTQYDNQKFTQPDNQIWARCSIKPGESSQVSIGSKNNNRYRNIGLLFVQIFQPLGEGDKAGLELADSIADAFRSVSDSGVTFRTPSIKNVGRSEGWWQINVKCPFYADQIS